MPSNFPTGIDTFTAKKVVDLEDALEAVEAKVGADSSAVTTSLDYKVARKADLSGGVVPRAQLGSGTADGTTALHGDGTWKAPAGGGGGGVTVQDEGTALATTATAVNFVGSGVTASGTGATKTISIPGASGAGADGGIGAKNFVTDFGADPTGAVKCDTALKNAIDWFRNNSPNSTLGTNGLHGGVLLVPAGVYVHDFPVDLADAAGITFMGASTMIAGNTDGLPTSLFIYTGTGSGRVGAGTGHKNVTASWSASGTTLTAAAGTFTQSDVRAHFTRANFTNPAKAVHGALPYIKTVSGDGATATISKGMDATESNVAIKLGRQGVWNLAGSDGIQFERVSFLFSNVNFQGNFHFWGSGIGGADAAYVFARDCIFQGANSGSAIQGKGYTRGIALKGNINSGIERCRFQGFYVGIDGGCWNDTNGGEFSNVVYVRNNIFVQCPYSAIMNANLDWEMTGNTFEAFRVYTNVRTTSNGALLPGSGGPTTIRTNNCSNYPEPDGNMLAQAWFYVPTVSNGYQKVFYTGRDHANGDFTGCSGGTGTIETAGLIQSIAPAAYRDTGNGNTAHPLQVDPETGLARTISGGASHGCVFETSYCADGYPPVWMELHAAGAWSITGNYFGQCPTPRVDGGPPTLEESVTLANRPAAITMTGSVGMDITANLFGYGLYNPNPGPVIDDLAKHYPPIDFGADAGVFGNKGINFSYNELQYGAGLPRGWETIPDLVMIGNSTYYDSATIRNPYIPQAATSLVEFRQGMATKVLAGTPTDASFPAQHPPRDGTIVWDSTGKKLWVRDGGVWRSSAAFT